MNRQWIRFLAAYLLLLNLPFWLTVWDGAPRAIFNLDYLAVGVLCLFFPRWLAISAASIALIVDVFRASAWFFYFTDRDFAYSFRYAMQIPAPRLILYAGLLLFATLSLAWLAVRLGKPSDERQRKALLLVSAVVLVAVVGQRFLLNGPSLTFAEHYPGVVWGNSQAVSAAKGLFASMRYQNEARQAVEGATSRSLKVMGTATPSPESRPQDNLVIVLVESLGLVKDAQMRQYLTSPIVSDAIRSIYRIDAGVVPFRGATTSAEFRELCGLKGSMLRDIVAHPGSIDFADHCLPLKLHALGYSSLAIHGFSGEMFERKSWYKSLGFDRSLFRNDLTMLGLPTCAGAFPGTCDSAIPGLIQHELTDRGHKKLIYWVTLNSHLPVPHIESAAKAAGCGEANAPVADPVVCDWLAIVRQDLQSIANVALSSEISPTEFIVVGDHAPPFISASRRNLFSQSSVPFLHLSPRNKAHAQSELEGSESLAPLVSPTVEDDTASHGTHALK